MFQSLQSQFCSCWLMWLAKRLIWDCEALYKKHLNRPVFVSKLNLVATFKLVLSWAMLWCHSLMPAWFWVSVFCKKKGNYQDFHHLMHMKWLKKYSNYTLKNHNMAFDNNLTVSFRSILLNGNIFGTPFRLAAHLHPLLQ